MSYPYNGNTGFSVNLASNHCVITTRLEDSTEHFPSTGTTRAICTRTLNLHYYHTRFLYSILNVFFNFQLLLPPLSHSHPSDPPTDSGETWNGSHHTTSVLVAREISVFRLFPNRHGPKIGGGCAPFLVRESWVPMSPGPRTTSIPSGIFIYLAIWSQQTWADRPKLGRGAASLPAPLFGGAHFYRSSP